MATKSDQAAVGHDLKLPHVADEFTQNGCGSAGTDDRRRDHCRHVRSACRPARARTDVHPLRLRAGDDRQRAQRPATSGYLALRHEGASPLYTLVPLDPVLLIVEMGLASLVSTCGFVEGR